MTVKVLFVCLGNICRSSTAHGIFQKLVEEKNLQQQIEIDSCGTGDWHIGHAPDPRAAEAAASRGYDLSALRARQVCPEDFEEFDYILAMDHANLNDLKALCPSGFDGVLELFLKYGTHAHDEVPDPYYNNAFDEVLDMVERASAELLAHILEKLDEKISDNKSEAV